MFDSIYSLYCQLRDRISQLEHEKRELLEENRKYLKDIARLNNELVEVKGVSDGD